MISLFAGYTRIFRNYLIPVMLWLFGESKRAISNMILFGLTIHLHNRISHLETVLLLLNLKVMLVIKREVNLDALCHHSTLKALLLTLNHHSRANDTLRKMFIYF